MKLLITDADSNYRTSSTDYCWTDPGEVLTVGTDGAFVGIDSGRYTTRGRIADPPRAEVHQKHQLPHPHRLVRAGTGAAEHRDTQARG